MLFGKIQSIKSHKEYNVDKQLKAMTYSREEKSRQLLVEIYQIKRGKCIDFAQ